MFGNFLYFIIALLIYTTYQPSSEPRLHPAIVFLSFFGLALIFAAGVRTVFRGIEARIGVEDYHRLEYRFNAAVNRYSIMALFIYAIDVYVLNLGLWLKKAAVFRMVPTFEALCFLGIFIIYLCLVWGFSHRAHARLYQTGISAREHILSNLTFSLPVLLPWFILSISADILQLLPFELPKRLLFSTEGQIVYFLVFLILIAIAGPGLIQKFWRCRPLGAGNIRMRIEALCRRTNMAYKDIMIWPLFGGRMITAGVMGLVRRFRYILVTPALLRHLEPHEIDAVIAHEIGHIKKKHLLFYLLFFAGYLIFAFASLDFIAYGIIYAQAAYGILGQNSGAFATTASISFSILMILIFLLYFRYGFGYFMRNFERQADLYAYTVIKDATPLISTFEKIAAASGEPPERPNWHHFSIQERIDCLRSCEQDPSRIHRHNSKVRKSIAVYLLLLALFTWAGLQINFGTAGGQINSSLLQSLVEKRLEQQPQNADLHVFLGDLHYSEKEYSRAAAAYNKAIANEPDNARALNNLAWLYATTREKNIFQPEKALDLAKRAARINPQPHVLDTLAQCYFVNGEYQKAVETEKEAIARAGENASHYRKQLQKFQKNRKRTP
ncbi:MAG: M48 family metalloprotease [Desulfosalsimonadaceae bacterium]